MCWNGQASSVRSSEYFCLSAILRGFDLTGLSCGLDVRIFWNDLDDFNVWQVLRTIAKVVFLCFPSFSTVTFFLFFLIILRFSPIHHLTSYLLQTLWSAWVCTVFPSLIDIHPLKFCSSQMVLTNSDIFRASIHSDTQKRDKWSLWLLHLDLAAKALNWGV